MLDAGQNPQLGFKPICESQLKSLDNFTSRMAQATDEAWAALVEAANDMARFYDIHQHKAPKYRLTVLATKCGLALRTSERLTRQKNSTTNGSAPIPSTRLSPIMHTGSNYLHLLAKSTLSSLSHYYAPMTMTLSPNARNATCHHRLRSSVMVSKNMKSKRFLTVGYSTGRSNT